MIGAMAIAPYGNFAIITSMKIRESNGTGLSMG